MKNYNKLEMTLDTCVEKTRININDLVNSFTSWSFDEEGKYERFNENFFDIGNWTTSFLREWHCYHMKLQKIHIFYRNCFLLKIDTKTK